MGSARLKIRSLAASECGPHRTRNEDAVLLTSRGPLHVMAVADGMGGGVSGDLASREALEAFARGIAGRIRAGEGLEDAVRDAILHASDAVRETGRRLSGGSSGGSVPGSDAQIGTTLTAVCICDGEAVVGHVGDSRAYVLRNRTLSRLTEDHSLVAELVRAGALPTSKTTRDGYSSVLTQAVGGVDVRPQIRRFVPQPGDLLLLCTDGVHRALTDATLSALLTAYGPDGARPIVAEAIASGTDDNVTALVATLEQVGPRKSRWPAAIAAILLLAGLTWGGQIFLNRSYFLGLHGDRVALYRGVPFQVAYLRLYRSERVFSVRVDDISPVYRERLERGIWVPDEPESVIIVRQMRQGRR